jgi:hypothetical protein
MRRIALVAATCLLSQQITQADIIQPKYGAAFFWPQQQTFGQSFTPTPEEARLESIGLLYQVGNVSSGPAHLTIDLLTLEGFGGDLIGSSALVIPETTPGDTWIDFQFSPAVNMVPGNRYTMRVTSLGGAGGTGLAGGWDSDAMSPYVGGHSINYAGELDIIFAGRFAYRDITFRVIGSPVPEPAALTLLSSIAIAICRRFRNNAWREGPSRYLLRRDIQRC